MPNKTHKSSQRRGDRRTARSTAWSAGRHKSGGDAGGGVSGIQGRSSLGTSAYGQMTLNRIPLFPTKFKAMLRYADNFPLTTTVGAVNTYVFSCNGLYDPNITGTGHQPAGFDQMMASYEHYVVTKARIGVVFVNPSGNAYPTVAVSVKAAATVVTNIQQIVEDGMVITDRLQGANTANCVVTLVQKVDIATFGGSKILVDNPYYRGDVISNPAEQIYFHIQTWNTDGATAAVTCEVVIEYEAIFTEPRALSTSLNKKLKELIIEEKLQESAAKTEARRSESKDDFHYVPEASGPAKTHPKPCVNCTGGHTA